MTPLFVNGEKCPSCYKLVEDCDMLDPNYHIKVKALQKEYYPLEIDPEYIFKLYIIK